MQARGLDCGTKHLTVFAEDPRDSSLTAADHALDSDYGWDDRQTVSRFARVDDRVLVLLPPASFYSHPDENRYYSIRCRIELAHDIRREALRLKQSLELHKNPFMCVHFRRDSEFESSCVGRQPVESCYQQSTIKAASMAARLHKRYQQELSAGKYLGLFVMTDLDQASKEYRMFAKTLQQVGQKANRLLLPSSKDESSKMRHLLIEQSICSDSDVFIRNAWSSVSRFVHDERRCRGHPTSSSHAWGLGELVLG